MSVEHSNKPLEEQLLFKLGTLEGTVVNGMRRIDEQLTSLVDNFSKHQTQVTIETELLKARVSAVEKWQEGAKVRAATLITVFTIVWAVFSGKIQAIASYLIGY